MHTLRNCGALWIVVACAVPLPAFATVTAATVAFIDAHPGTRLVVSEGRLTAIYGAPFASDADPATSTDAFVDAFITANGSALGVSNPDLVLLGKRDIRNGKLTVYTYTQRIEAIPVHGSVVKISVFNGATETIGYVGIRLTSLPLSPLLADILTNVQATTAVANAAAYPNLTTFTAPEKVIFTATDGTLHRTWRLSGNDGGDASFLFFVDTSSGNIVGVIDQIARSGVSGTVTGYATPCCPNDGDPTSDCCSADDPTNPASCPGAPIPILGARVSIFVSGVEAGFDFTDDEGLYVVSELPDGVSADVRVVLQGEYQTLIHDPLLASVPSNLAITTPGTSSGVLENQDFVFNPTDPVCSPWPAPVDTAQVNVFRGIEETHAWYMNRGGSSLMEVPFTTELFVLDAFYSYVGDEFCFMSPDFGPTDAFHTVIAHEYGHRILFKERLDTASDDILSEGVADATSALKWNNSRLGDELIGFVRDVTSGVTFDNPTDVCTGSTSHCRGLAIAGAFWDLRGTLRCCADDPEGACAGTVTLCPLGTECAPGQFCEDRPTEELFVDFIAVTTGDWDETIVLEVLGADDDNGDLTDGTPHGVQILNSFVTQHGWPLPEIYLNEGGIKVEWEGPSGTPVEGVDYIVNDTVDPPNVTLITMVKDAVPVARWFVGRTEIDRSPASLGNVTALWVGNPNHDITVELGTPPSRPCRDVTFLGIPSQGPSNWSSLLLKLTGGIQGAVFASAATEGEFIGDGGRLSGSIAGDSGVLSVGAIGVGNTSPGTLDVGGDVTGSIAFIPTLSALTASSVQGLLEITDGLHGTLQLDRFDGTAPQTEITVDSASGITTGDILVDGDASNAITIFGDMAGDIIATGAITGMVNISGTFDGNICDSVLSPLKALPPNIAITDFGSNATICGAAPLCLNGCAPLPVDVIDARYPHDPGDSFVAFGWNVMSLELGAGTSAVAPSDFTVNVVRGGLSIGVDPLVVNAILDGTVAVVQFDRPLPAGAWTQVTHAASGISHCLGALPGDVNGDGVVHPSDLLDLLDNINGVLVPPLELWQCDIDRSGVCNSADWLAFMDLLNGASQFNVWYSTALPNSPCGAVVASCSQCEPASATIGGSRYLGIDVAPGSDDLRIRVTCPNGNTYYVGQPSGPNNIATLVASVDSAFLTPAAWGGAVYVTGPEIAPSAVSLPSIYEVRADFSSHGSSFEAIWAPVSVTNPLWGDANNDGLANFTDISCVVAGFLGDFSTCSLYATDLTGSSSELSSTPQGAPVDFRDVWASVAAFLGTPPYPCTACSGSCPSSSTVVGGTGAAITLTPASASILPGDAVVLEVHMTGVTVPIQAYQLGVDIAGGTSGNLTLEAISIDVNHLDYIFNGLTTYPVAHLGSARLASVRESGAVVPADGAYLGTFTFRAGPLASGAFTIDIRATDAGFLNANDEVQISSLGGASIQILTGGCNPTCAAGSMCCSGVCQECCNDTDCADGLFCNGNETCVSGTCNAGSFPCTGGVTCIESTDTCGCVNDGECADALFCNGAETCSSGTCGAGSDPCPGQQCNEATQACVSCNVDADCQGTQQCCSGNCQACCNNMDCPGFLNLCCPAQGFVCSFTCPQ